MGERQMSHTFTSFPPPLLFNADTLNLQHKQLDGANTDMTNSAKRCVCDWMMGGDGARGARSGEVFKDVDTALCQCA